MTRSQVSAGGATGTPVASTVDQTPPAGRTPELAAAVELLMRQVDAQGLDRQITDPGTLAKVAALAAPPVNRTVIA